jgi:hypothetical protein
MSTLPPEDAYRFLADIFTRRSTAEVLAIEILSPGFGPLLQDGTYIGITKKALVQAFLVARQLFFERLARMDGDDFLYMFKQGQDDLSVATEIILLFDCEHITACNWRKRRLNALLQQHSNGDRDHHDFLVGLLQRERSLMTTYLCSPLHRHTKSPTLWEHRLWTTRQITTCQHSSQSLKSGILRQSTEEVFDAASSELGVVLRAGELHPRNYYAFAYMRQLLCIVYQLLAGKSADTTDPQSISSHLATIIVEPTLKWCLAHPRDVSGWTFLYYALCNVVSTNHHDEHLLQQRNDVMSQVVHFAVNVADWEGESLWSFVDMMVTKFGQEILPLSVRHNVTEHEPKVSRQNLDKDTSKRDGDQKESEHHKAGYVPGPTRRWSRMKQLIFASCNTTQ